jgi:arginine utilization protein RocB
VAGLETHVGEPFSGFDPNWLSAEVTRRVDYNPDLCDQALGEVTPPPVSLKATDSKDVYTVQTALYSWSYYNWFTFTRSAAEVLEQFRGQVADAFADLHLELTDRARRYAAMGTAARAPVPVWAPRVYTFAELAAVVAERMGPAYQQEVADRLMQEPGLDLRTYSCKLTEALWRASSLPAPAAVVGYAQIYSPPVRLDPGAPLLAAARQAAEGVASETGLEIQVRHFFPYISDMSFLSCPEGPDGLAALQGNSPGWGRLYRVDHEAHARLDLPVINIGPWGTGAHTRHERVHRAFSCGAMPELLWRTLMEA